MHTRPMNEVQNMKELNLARAEGAFNQPPLNWVSVRALSFYFSRVPSHVHIYLVKFDDVWMPEKFQVLDFSSDLAHHIQHLDFLTVQDFNCNLVLGDLVKSNWKTLKLNLNFWMNLSKYWFDF